MFLKMDLEPCATLYDTPWIWKTQTCPIPKQVKPKDQENWPNLLVGDRFGNN